MSRLLTGTRAGRDLAAGLQGRLWSQHLLKALLIRYFSETSGTTGGQREGFPSGTEGRKL